MAVNVREFASHIKASAKRIVGPLAVGTTTIVSGTGFRSPTDGGVPGEVQVGLAALGLAGLAVALAYNLFIIYKSICNR